MLNWIKKRLKPKKNQPQKLSVEGYERRLRQLLELASQDGQPKQVQALLADVDEQKFGEWLWRWGKDLQPEETPELAVQLGKLARLNPGIVGSVAGAIGERLMSNLQPTPEASEADPKHELLQAGIAQLQAGNTEAALATFEQAIAENPQDQDAWYQKGLALQKLGQYGEAIAANEMFLALNNSFVKASKLPETQSTPKLFDIQVNSTAEAWFEKGNQQFIKGNFQEAIASYDNALEFKPDFHEAWYNRGSALDNLGRTEEEIASYDKALEIKPDFHEAWYNRGSALGNLGRTEEAIASYDKALEIKPFHIAWYNRGVALGNLGLYEEEIASYDKALEIKPDLQAWNNRGSALDNLGRTEEAIASYDKALEIKPDYHEAWVNRGIALWGLGRYEEAIASYDKALEIKPDYHKALGNRGVALGNLGLYEEAIASYDKALEIKPDYHEAWLNRGIALGNLGRYEEAIASYDKALEIKPDFHEAWYNRGIAVLSSAHHVPVHALIVGATLNQLHPQLNQRGYPGQVTTLETGLTHVALHSEGWIFLQQRLGEAHFDQAKRQSQSSAARSLLHKARHCFEEALAVVVNATSSELEVQLEILQGLIRVHLALGNLEVARQYQQQGRSLFEQIRAAQPDTAKPKIERRFASFSQLEIDLLIGENAPTQALEQAEFYKNRCLTWILDAWQETVISPEFAEMQALCSADTAIIYWHLSPDSLTTFILTTNAAEPWVLEGDRAAQAQKLERWMKDWDADYRDYASKKPSEVNASERSKHPWRIALNARLTELRQILNIDALLQTVSAQHLILVPHRDLHRFPLHALFPESLTCTYLPSIQIGLNLHQKANPNPGYTPLLIVEDPETEQQSLDYSQLEAAILEKLLPQDCKRIRREEATVEQVKTQLSHAHSTFHFTGHGIYNALYPENSALGLVDGNFTAQAIRQLNLSHYQLISLAACETALTGKESIQTEYVGLASAALKAGATNVLSTLWPVEQAPSCWFIVRFYQELLQSHSPAIALKNTQIWLRSSSCPTLIDWIQRDLLTLPDLGYSRNKELQAAIIDLENRAGTIERDPPYSDPLFWAAFILTGQGSL